MDPEREKIVKEIVRSTGDMTDEQIRNEVRDILWLLSEGVYINVKQRQNAGIRASVLGEVLKRRVKET